MDYILKSNDERVVVNNFIENDPLSENNLDKTLDLVNKIRLSRPNKTIWLYTGYDFVEILKDTANTKNIENLIRFMILKNVDVLVDGQYIESQHDLILPYRGSKNQKLIDIKKSLQKGKVILWCG